MYYKMDDSLRKQPSESERNLSPIPPSHFFPEKGVRKVEERGSGVLCANTSTDEHASFCLLQAHITHIHIHTYIHTRTQHFALLLCVCIFLVCDGCRCNWDTNADTQLHNSDRNLKKKTKKLRGNVIGYT